jgi:hypothetical protein
MSSLTRTNIEIKVTRDELTRYLDIIKEMNKISNTHKVKWCEEGVLFYSIRGEEGEESAQGKINFLKTFFLKRKEVFAQFPDGVNIDYTILEGKKYHQKYSLLLDEDLDEYNLDIRYIEDYNVVENFKGIGKIYKSLTAIAGESSLVKDFNPTVLLERLDPEMSDSKFELSVDMLKQVLKSIKMETENDLLELTISDGEITFSESQFELVVGHDDSLEDGEWMFKKEYMKSIIPHPDSDSVTFSMFPSYISVDEHKSYILFTLSL